MTQEVPTKVAGAEWDLGFRFLNPVFPKKRQAQAGRRRNGFWRMKLADREQLNGIRRAARAFAGARHLVTKVCESTGQWFHRIQHTAEHVVTRKRGE